MTHDLGYVSFMDGDTQETMRNRLRDPQSDKSVALRLGREKALHACSRESGVSPQFVLYRVILEPVAIVQASVRVEPIVTPPDVQLDKERNEA